MNSVAHNPHQNLIKFKSLKKDHSEEAEQSNWTDLKVKNHLWYD